MESERVRCMRVNDQRHGSEVELRRRPRITTWFMVAYGLSAFGHTFTHSPTTNKPILKGLNVQVNMTKHPDQIHNNKPHKLATGRHRKLTILGRFSSCFLSPALGSLVGCSTRLRDSSRNYTRGQCLWVPNAPYPREVLLPTACDFVSSAGHSSELGSKHVPQSNMPPGIPSSQLSATANSSSDLAVTGPESRTFIT